MVFFSLFSRGGFGGVVPKRQTKTSRGWGKLIICASRRVQRGRGGRGGGLVGNLLDSDWPGRSALVGWGVFGKPSLTAQTAI